MQWIDTVDDKGSWSELSGRDEECGKVWHGRCFQTVNTVYGLSTETQHMLLLSFSDPPLTVTQLRNYSIAYHLRSCLCHWTLLLLILLFFLNFWYLAEIGA